jgi:hypothetical protein
MAYERYRIWLKNGNYEVAVARNKEEAVEIAVRNKGVKRSQIKAVGRATSRGRLFTYPF